MSSFNLEIVTPIRDYNLEDVSYVRCPGLDGLFGVMHQHREGIIALIVGEVKVTKRGKHEYYATGGGFAEILSDGVKLLVESLEKSSEIDAGRAQQSLDRAKQRKSDKNTELDDARIDASLTRALNRLRISKR